MNNVSTFCGVIFDCANCAVDVCCRMRNRVAFNCSCAIPASSILLFVASVLVMAILNDGSFEDNRVVNAPTFCKAVLIVSNAVSTFVRAPCALAADRISRETSEASMLN